MAGNIIYQSSPLPEEFRIRTLASHLDELNSSQADFSICNILPQPANMQLNANIGARILAIIQILVFVAFATPNLGIRADFLNPVRNPPTLCPS